MVNIAPVGEISSIRLSACSEQYVPCDACTVETWRVAADLDGVDGDAGHVGDFEFYLVDLVEGGNPLWLLDGIDSSAGQLAEDLFAPETGEFLPAAEEFTEPGIGAYLLILNHAELAPAFRGQGLGPILAGRAIQMLRRGCVAVACFPCPLDRTGPHAGADRTDEAFAKLGGVWTSLGFKPISAGADSYMLNLALTTLDKRMAELISAYASR